MNLAIQISYLMQLRRQQQRPSNWCTKCVCRTFWYSARKSNCPQCWSGWESLPHCSHSLGRQMPESLVSNTAATQLYWQIPAESSTKSPAQTASYCVAVATLWFYRIRQPLDDDIWSLVGCMTHMLSIKCCDFVALRIPLEQAPAGPNREANTTIVAHPSVGLLKATNSASLESARMQKHIEEKRRVKFSMVIAKYEHSLHLLTKQIAMTMMTGKIAMYSDTWRHTKNVPNK